MKYLLSVSAFISLLALGLGINNTFNFSNFVTKIAVIDSDKIVTFAITRIKENQYADKDKIRQVGQEYKTKIRITLEQYAKDNNIVIIDKKAILTNNVKDLTDEFIKTFINY
ncbi:hypothetical protein A9K75_06640 [Campylobacter fetus subsp. testudinum]|uniref:hypothetical protein n=1 Tax=Campylobacter fetus TaxID=196 RepID=UPI0008188D96|nr:hypothetical protein [Campylobacter fetus]OCR99543.1 hypothetical protein A9K75_06640 [Campylobacter fetus subsp. testudinum]